MTSRALQRLGPYFRVACAMLLAIFLFLPSTARATAGRPAGWSFDRASEQIVIGRLVLRYEPHLESEALRLADAAPSWWSDVETALAGDLDDTLVITFVDHAGRVAEASGMPRWVAGVAHPESGEIAIARHGPDGSRTDLSALLKHEMAHVALYRATAGANVPRWLHEGVAESFTDEIDLTRAQTLAGAVFGPGVPDIDELDVAFRRAEGRDAAVAYAAARDLVTHLRYRDANGARFRQLLTEVRNGHDLDAAFVRAYGLALPELVSEWRTGLGGRFIWYVLAASGGLPFVVLAPLLGMAWFRRRRVLRLSWQRIEREEALARGAMGLGPSLA